MEDINKMFDELKAYNDAQREYRIQTLQATRMEKVKRLEKKNEALKEVEFERDLIENDLVNFIKNDINHSDLNMFSYYNGSKFDEAWRYYRYKNNPKISETTWKKKDEEEAETTLNYLIHTVKDKFELDDKYKLIDLIMYSGVLKGLLFKYNYDNKFEIEIFIPNFVCANKESYKEYLDGYTIYYKDSDISSMKIASRLDYRELAVVLKSWVKNKVRSLELQTEELKYEKIN